jgi:apolipoprotein N-acyltransferase
VTSRILYAALLGLHCAGAAAGLLLVFRARQSRLTSALLLGLPEVLFSLACVFFLFTYIYAANANMDYVQRFVSSSHGTLLIAPDSTQERRDACLRFLPLLLFDAAWYIGLRLKRPKGVTAALAGESGIAAWALPLSVVSGFLNALAFPSFLTTGGLPVLGWLCLVPLMMSCAEVPVGRGVFYGTLAGVLQTAIANFWLGTFNLLTLQFVIVVTALEYIPFMAVALWIFRRCGRLGWLVFPAAWTVFDWVRSMGFLGYPWGMLGASQYAVIPVIQVASLAGVWGVTFLVTLFNSMLATYVRGWLNHARTGPWPGVLCAAVLLAAFGWAGGGAVADAATAARAPAANSRTARIALVQQNDDPRKDDYRAVFDTLRRLTDGVRGQRPDLVAWSETAFVPNIRRWSAEDPKSFPLAALVRDFLSYQKGVGTWLLTGNDDYSFETRDGVQERLDYNGSVLFSPSGERVDTYHKIHLVPFTEYFPYRKQLPGIYRLLQSFDAYLWETGDRRVVFRHPKFSFSTPICFEDAFPDDVRRFVTAGAEVILNISNDYWSLTEAEGMQHAANAVFRAVENGRPLARASASGLTCFVDPRGRILARTPFFQENTLVVDVPLSSLRTTLYTLWGDWFPFSLAAALAVVLCVLLVGGVVRRIKRT